MAEFEATNYLLYDSVQNEVGRLTKGNNGHGELVIDMGGHTVDLEATVAKMGLHPEKHYDLSEGAHCDINDHKTCEMRVAVGMAADVSNQAGVPLTPGLKRIWDEQAASETQLKQAIIEWAQAVPEHAKEEADGIVYIVHNSEDIMNG